MKKWIIRLFIVAAVLIVLAALAVHFFLGAGIKKGVETVGPMLTKVDIKLDSVNVSVLSGSGSIKGLVVGNPEGYKTPSAIKVGAASLVLNPGSLLGDKVVIRSVKVQGPEISFETNLKENNLTKILANVEAATGGAATNAPAESSSASKKLQVDDFLISGGQVHVSLTTFGGKSATVPLPDIHLTNLGQGPEGITAAELTKVVLNELQKVTAQVAAGAVADLGKAAADLTRDAGKAATDAAGQATKSITDIFKKKQ